jgi:hypothetical protein
MQANTGKNEQKSPYQLTILLNPKELILLTRKTRLLAVKL